MGNLSLNEYFKVDWNENTTREHALEKLDEMLPLVAYPDELLDDETLDNYYKNLTVYPESFLRTMLSYNLFFTKLYLENLRKPVVRDDWTSGLYGSASVVNAMYHRSTNTIRELF